MKNFNKKIKDILAIKTFRYDDVPGLITRNSGRPMVSIILKLLIPLGGRLTPSWVRVTVKMMSQFNLIARKQGLQGLIKTLKVCSVLLQQSLSGHILHDITPLGMRVGRTRGGIPRLIPMIHRRFIKQGNTLVIRYYLTIFSLYRDIIIPGKIKINTIIAPFNGDPNIFKRLQGFIPAFSRLFAIKPLVPHSYESFIDKGGKFFSGWNPKEAFPYVLNSLGTRYIPSKASISKLVDSRPRIWHQLNPFKLNSSKGFKQGWQPFPIAKSSPLTTSGQISTHPRALLKGLAVLSMNKALGTDLMTVIDRVDHTRGFARFWYKRYYKLLTTSIFPLVIDIRMALGKLGLKFETAGKVRVFAMVDAFTQWALRPLHKYLFSLLRQHSMDGTFDQLAPLNKAWGHKALYSLDLSAATDRLPIRLQESLLADLLADKEYAAAWRRLLVDRDYTVPKAARAEGCPPTVRYAVGQPMGALSSWAMLAYTHHFIVQCAAWETGHSNKILFREYAILGDDIVIFNERVALKYLDIIKSLGVECGLAKSVISPKGVGLEFAKKTFLKSVNVSPAPLKELSSALGSLAGLREYARLYKLSFNQVAKLTGAGYKVMGGLNKPLNKQNNLIRLLRIVFFVPTSVVEMGEFYLSLTHRIKGLQLNKVLDGFIRSYFTRFYHRVGALLLKLENMSDLQYMASKDSMIPFTGKDKYRWLELERELYTMAYHPYYQDAIKTLKNIMRQIEEIKSSYVIGIWRLYGRTLEMERELSSISTDLFLADKIDASPSPQAKDIRFWRAFSKELRHIKTSQLTSNNKVVKMSESSIIWWFPLVFRFPKGLIWKSLPLATKVVRQVIKRIPVPIVRQGCIWSLKLLFKVFYPFLILICGIILIIGLLAIWGQDWMWDTTVSPSTSSSLYGLLTYYYGTEPIPVQPMVQSGGHFQLWLIILLGIFFSFWLGTGALYYHYHVAVTFAIHIQELRITQILGEGPDLTPFQTHIVLFRFWVNVFERITIGMWEMAAENAVNQISPWWEDFCPHTIALVDFYMWPLVDSVATFSLEVLVQGFIYFINLF